jgi:mannose-6-phosphate isomerase-like protein (cupin superfamily)
MLDRQSDTTRKLLGSRGTGAMTRNIRSLIVPVAVMLHVGWFAALVLATPQEKAIQKEQRTATNLKFENLPWQKIFPDWPKDSPEIAILHIDPETKATQLMIRIPKGFHVPEHWHTANETHTIVSGTFIIECGGKREELGAGSFNYMPRKMVHQGWTKPSEGTLLFITVDRAWDLNWVNGPPHPPEK